MASLRDLNKKRRVSNPNPYGRYAKSVGFNPLSYGMDRMLRRSLNPWAKKRKNSHLALIAGMFGGPLAALLAQKYLDRQQRRDHEKAMKEHLEQMAQAYEEKKRKSGNIRRIVNSRQKESDEIEDAPIEQEAAPEKPSVEPMPSAPSVRPADVAPVAEPPVFGPEEAPIQGPKNLVKKEPAESSEKSAKDVGYIVLGRDKSGKFRKIDNKELMPMTLGSKGIERILTIHTGLLKSMEKTLVKSNKDLNRLLTGKSEITENEEEARSQRGEFVSEKKQPGGLSKGESKSSKETAGGTDHIVKDIVEGEGITYILKKMVPKIIPMVTTLLGGTVAATGVMAIAGITASVLAIKDQQNRAKKAGATDEEVAQIGSIDPETGAGLKEQAELYQRQQQKKPGIKPFYFGGRKPQAPEISPKQLSTTSAGGAISPIEYDPAGIPARLEEPNNAIPIRMEQMAIHPEPVQQQMAQKVDSHNAPASVYDQAATKLPSNPIAKKQSNKKEKYNKDQENIQSLIIKMAKESGVDPQYILTIARHESAFNPKVKDNMNANGTKDYGIMQLNDTVLKQYGLTTEQAHDPRTNIQVGIDLFKSQLDYFKGDKRKALSAYMIGRHGEEVVLKKDPTLTGSTKASAFLKEQLPKRMDFVENGSAQSIIEKLSAPDTSPSVQMLQPKPSEGIAVNKDSLDNNINKATANKSKPVIIQQPAAKNNGGGSSSGTTIIASNPRNSDDTYQQANMSTWRRT